MKVFLVDDEIAIRESLRNSFPWEEKGFQLVGEAPDGEMALPMIRDLNVDILLTDIRMPFMDGMKLCEEVQRTMPWVERIILSGYDDFEYARRAITLGVREYLLKPVTAQELGEVLERTRRQIEEKRRERENLSALRSRNRSENAFLREKLLESLFTDEGDPADDDAVMRQMRGLGVNLVAGCYAVLDIAFTAEGAARSACRAALAALAEMNGGAVFVCSGAKGARALVMGDHPEDVEERAYSFANSAMHLPEMEKEENLLICIGDTVEDFHEIRRSMRSARHLRHLQTADGPAPRGIFSPGNRGGAGDSAVVRARLYLEEHFSDPNLMLQNAAEEVHLSQSHLSTIFAQETGMTFTQYLTALRIAKARELLETTELRSFQIAGEVGYNDAHYFSYMFKRSVGMTPGEYRRESRRDEKENEQGIQK